MSFVDKLKHAWNAFISEDNTRYPYNYRDIGYSSTYRPDRKYFTNGNERSIITSVYNRIAMDCAAVSIQHVKLDNNKRYIEDVKSGLNNCLTIEANKDQESTAFMQDIVMSLFDEGVVAIVPIDTTSDIKNGTFDIDTMRTGRITNWYPDHVRVEVYNDRKGIKEELILPKSGVAIVENPFYAVMNERNSVLQRLIVKLNLLDAIDEQSGSGKLDLIIQLPYVVKSDARKAQAEKRRLDIETQLSGSKYGIAYTDGTEKVTQLNRSVENNLLTQIEYLTSMLYSQLNIDTSVLNGTANDETMLNYTNRTVAIILTAITKEMERKFLTKTARSQGKALRFYTDPFKLLPISKVADIADKLARNEILTSNEIRQKLGFKPINDGKSDMLRNSNMPNPSPSTGGQEVTPTVETPEESPTSIALEPASNTDPSIDSNEETQVEETQTTESTIANEPASNTDPTLDSDSEDDIVSEYEIVLKNQSGSETKVVYEANSEEDAIKKALDGVDVPKDNIISVRKL